MKVNPELPKFLIPYDSNIQILVIQLRDFITDLVPEANELIWDNYNAVAMAYSKSEKLKDAFCHISVYPKHVNFGFNRGAELQKSEINLIGTGKLIRHIVVKDFDTFPREKIKEVIRNAIDISEEQTIQLANKTSIGRSIVMLISDKKLRPTKGKS